MKGTQLMKLMGLALRPATPSTVAAEGASEGAAIAPWSSSSRTICKHSVPPRRPTGAAGVFGFRGKGS